MRSSKIVKATLSSLVTVLLSLVAATTAAAGPKSGTEAGNGSKSAGKPAATGPVFDFTEYLRQQEFEEAQVRLSTEVTPTSVTIKGVDYLRLEAAAGTLYVPSVARLTPEALETGLCASSFRSLDVESATVGAVSLEVGRTVKAQAPLVVETIHRRCDGNAAAPANAKAKDGREIAGRQRPARGGRVPAKALFHPSRVVVIQTDF
jgi:hypothetical protein